MRGILILISFILSAYTAQNVQTYKGYIVSVQRYNLVNKPASYIQFVLNAGGEEFTVELGPEWYVSEQGIILIPREEIEVTGSIITTGDQKIIVANQIKKRDVRINLRQENGTPLWQ